MIWRAWDWVIEWWEWDTAIIAALVAATCTGLFATIYFFMHNHCERWLTRPCTQSVCTNYTIATKNQPSTCIAWTTYQTTCEYCERWVPDEQ